MRVAALAESREALGRLSESLLVAAWARDGDAAALGELLRRWDGFLRRVVAVALGAAGRRDPGLRDDAMQETFLRLRSALRRWMGEASLEAFAAGVARRAALEELRRFSRRRAKAERAAALGPAECLSSVDPAEELGRRELADALMEALLLMREPDRSLLYLRDAEGMALRDLARQFKMAEGTVKSRLSRARASLRARFPEVEEDRNGR